MAKGDWLVLLGSVVLVLIPASAHSGELSNGDYAAFAIRPEGSCGDVKTRLWSGVNVAALAPDLSIRCDESSSCYPWKMAIVRPYFGSAKQVADQRTNAALGIKIGSVVTVGW